MITNNMFYQEEILSLDEICKNRKSKFNDSQYVDDLYYYFPENFEIIFYNDNLENIILLEIDKFSGIFKIALRESITEMDCTECSFIDNHHCCSSCRGDIYYDVSEKENDIIQLNFNYIESYLFFKILGYFMISNSETNYQKSIIDFNTNRQLILKLNNFLENKVDIYNILYILSYL